MNAYVNGNDFEPEHDDGLPDETPGARSSGVPLAECDHGELLRLIIGEGAEAAMETFFDAKDPNIDPALKLKLIGLQAASVITSARPSQRMQPTSAVRAEPMSDHPRNIGPMHTSPRCGARTRSGALCRSPAIAGKARCRMHGGKGSGAPKGNRNALRQGLYTKEVLAREARLRDVCRRLRATIDTVEGNHRAANADKI